MRDRCCTIAVVTHSWNGEPVFALTPARRRGREILDDPSENVTLAVRSLRDVALSNRLFGGQRAVLRELAPLLHAHRDTHRANVVDTPCTLLDVGTGLGDIPLAALALAARLGVTLRTIGLELDPALAAAAAPHCSVALSGDAMQLPFADGSIDVVTVSQVLHHFESPAADDLLRECMRVARVAVIIHDLRRSWFAVGGLWSVSFLLGFHAVSRNDGVVSILRGFTVHELRALVHRATGRAATVRRALGWRITATWRVGTLPF